MSGDRLFLVIYEFFEDGNGISVHKMQADEPLEAFVKVLKQWTETTELLRSTIEEDSYTLVFPSFVDCSFLRM